MEKKIVFKAISIVILLILIISCNKVPKFDHYGVYIKDGKDFREIKGYEWSGVNDIYSNSRNFDKTQILFDDELELYVYSPKAKVSEYKLICPTKKSRKGDFISANFGFGRKSPEAEITVEPIENKDDMILIRSKPNFGPFILHVKEESKGYVFNAKNTTTMDDNNEETPENLSKDKVKTYEKEIRKTVNNWIKLLNKSKYIEFFEQYLNPTAFKSMKESGEFDDEFDNPEQEAEQVNEMISEFRLLLKEKPIVNHNFISFNNSKFMLCKINGRWHRYIEVKEYTPKPVKVIK